MHRNTSPKITKREVVSRVELDYFEIEGVVGGNQEWFSNVVMNMGGCAAAAACDTCIYFERRFGNRGWYPFDVSRLTRNDYVAFSQIMKPYIKPRVGGVRKPEWFVEGFSKYLEEHPGCDRPELKMKIVHGTENVEKAGKLLKNRIDRGYPVPFLLLRHENRELFEDYIWHWFMVIGYEESEEGIFVQTATYGAKRSFSFREMWNTGYDEKGGMILYELI